MFIVHIRVVKRTQDAMKKKRDVKLETRIPLSEVTTTDDGRCVAGGSKSLAALNLSDNRELGVGAAIQNLLTRLVKARKEMQDPPPLQELHLSRCQVAASGGKVGKEDGEEEGEKKAALTTAACLALRPTLVYV